ncbi:hypothetical protein IMSHALPRED_006160 [Imshaugia aleurites]|uniref:RING-type domain-containing protein n=1 Tax=Imshaugia aleurites TaxID=172621 RepID=A0A8H3ISF2_9LECA|nr:hypothetical protein IMSHALPRED_006160 [Imshaugia aleurites]
MPAEILNQLEPLVPKIEASIANKRVIPAMKTEPLDPLKSELRAMKFILNLPIIDVDFLHDDEKRCGLCDGTYDAEFRVCGRGEVPCHLPCGHIAGHWCLREWLSPYEGGFTKCPFCSVDFPQMFADVEPPPSTTGDLASEDRYDHEVSDGELSRQVSQLSKDSGASADEIRRYLSIDEVLERARSQIGGLDLGTEVRDFADHWR